MIGQRRLVAGVLVLLLAGTACSTAEVQSAPGQTETTLDRRFTTEPSAPDAEVEPPDSLAALDDAGSEPVISTSVPPTTSTEPVGAAVGEGEDDAPEPQTDLDLLEAELMGFVERERGHTFTTRPELRLLSGTEFTAAFADVVRRDAERYSEDFANFTDIYRAMGIIDGSKNLAEIWFEFGDAGVLGFYDTDVKNIVLRGGEITPLTETVLVHELTHALDDQVFGIDRPEYDDRDDEISWSLSAIVEGNALVIEDRYRATLSETERTAEITARQNLPRGVSLSSFTMSFRELQFSRYRHGREFVDRLWLDGVEAVDEALTSPPPTSEMVVDASQYSPGAAGDGPALVPVAGGSVFESGVWGEIAWAAIFADVDSGRAEAAADGWGGDWYVAWRSGDRTCVRAHIEADTAADLDDYAAMLEDWVTLGDREVFYPNADLIRVTSCG